MRLFLAHLRQAGGLRITREKYVRAYFLAHPELNSTAERHAHLWQALVTLNDESQLKLPSKNPKNWDAIGSPRLPQFITLVALHALDKLHRVDWLPALQLPARPATGDATRTWCGLTTI